MATKLTGLAASQVLTGGQAVTAVIGPVLGGFIVNPFNASGPLYVDMVKPAAVVETATCFVIHPGQRFVLPGGFAGNLSVNANDSGHGFSGVVLREPTPITPPVPVLGEAGKPFPPTSPSVITDALPSYLYQQYSDDDDLQAFVAAFNAMQQDYVDWFANLNPADYTQEHIQGVLLDWIAAGLYGMERPWLPSGHSKIVGPLNTWAMNTWALNRLAVLPPEEFILADDDIFKRILTWHIYKDDGDIFTIRWLKRRIERFLTGTNGTGGASNGSPPWLAPDQTYEVSVTFGVGNQVNINFQTTRRRFAGGALLNTFALNTRYLNEFDTTAITLPAVPLAPIFKAAVDSGALELPFQFHFTVNL